MIADLALIGSTAIGNLAAGASLIWIYLHRRSCAVRRFADLIPAEVIDGAPETRERQETMRREIGDYADFLAQDDSELRNRLRRFEDGES